MKKLSEILTIAMQYYSKEVMSRGHPSESNHKPYMCDAVLMAYTSEELELDEKIYAHDMIRAKIPENWTLHQFLFEGTQNGWNHSKYWCWTQNEVDIMNMFYCDWINELKEAGK